MKISILIPVYNEARTLLDVVQRVTTADVPSGCTKEIIVIDDGSSDGTAELLSELDRNGRATCVKLGRNQGKGTAIRVGLAIATGDVILIQDGDLEYDPDDYLALLNPLVSSQAKVVYGSRFRGTAEGMKWHARIANAILTFSANTLYGAGLTDEATAYKAFRTEVLLSLDLRCERFEFCSEVTAKLRRRDYDICEVPIHYRARTVSEGKKIRAMDGITALWTLFRLRFARIESKS